MEKPIKKIETPTLKMGTNFCPGLNTPVLFEFRFSQENINSEFRMKK